MTILARETKANVDRRPTPSVTYWLTASPWHGNAPVDDLYREYVSWSAGGAVPFDRFLHDVGTCGVELILADGMFLFSRP